VRADDLDDLAALDRIEAAPRDDVGIEPDPVRHRRHFCARAVDVVHFRHREAGTQRAHVDAVAPVLERERLRELDQVRLRRRIQRVARRCRHQAGQRGDVDDASAAALAHAGHEAIAELGRRGDHHLDEFLVRLPLARDEAAGHAIAGIVDEQIDGDAAPPRFVEQKLRRVRVGEIGGDAFDGHAVTRAQLGRQRFQAFETSRRQYQRMAACCELFGERGADAGRGAGDESVRRFGHRGTSAGRRPQRKRNLRVGSKRGL